MTTAIKFENVSKQYRLGEVGSGTLADDLHRAWAKLRGQPDPLAKVGQVNDREVRSEQLDGRKKNGILSKLSRRSPEYVWALKDIDFQVKQGEILGIIGRNGAGKSTLLKLLSRVTAPTQGTIKANGRIASLLEVGTGFHPELTGRENIYLNGAILGMRRYEIAKQLDAIIDFSGCAKYIDTPVKRYSSGMTVRLGFSVAAHLDCEILVVDEVLAVGDTEFQSKCIGKMQEISSQGSRTVIFVSHNMKAVRSLCTRGVVINQGAISYMGTTDSAVDQYQAAGFANCSVSFSERTDRNGDGNVQFTKLMIRAVNGEPVSATSPIRFEMEYSKPDGTEIDRGRVVIGIYDVNHTSLYRFDTDLRTSLPRKMPNTGKVTCTCESLHTTPGPLFVSLAFFEEGQLQDHIVHAERFDILETNFFNTARSFSRADCLFLVEHAWDVSAIK